MKPTITTREKECNHDEFIVLHTYFDTLISGREYICLTESEQDIGPEFMQHAKVAKGRCVDCKCVFLIKFFEIKDVLPN